MISYLRLKVRHIALLVLSVLGGATLGAALVAASTNIGVNIQTDGTLSVTGTAAASSTLQVTGVTTLYNNLLLLQAYGIDTLAAGQLNIGTTTANAITIGSSGITTTIPGTLVVSTSASTTNLKVGSDQVSTVSGMIFGYCTIADISVVTASSTVQTTCAGATGMTSSYRVFVQATSSLPLQLVIQSATSTTGAINVRIMNPTGGVGTPAAAPVSLNFWAVR